MLKQIVEKFTQKMYVNISVWWIIFNRLHNSIIDQISLYIHYIGMLSALIHSEHLNTVHESINQN